MAEPFFPTIWNVLHDGSIDAITGQVPGHVTVTASCEYLRERFAEPGDAFVIGLRNCVKLQHRLTVDTPAETNLQSIADQYLGILSAEMHDSVCRIYTDKGILELQCDDGSLALDSGRAVPVDELLSVADAYWDEWETKRKS